MAKKNIYQRRKPRRKMTRAERSHRVAENLFKGYVKFCAQRLSRQEMLVLVNQHFEELLVEQVMKG